MGLDKESKLRAAFATEFEKYQTASSSIEKWSYLERLHIIGQLLVSLHLKTHWLMLKLAIKEANATESLGQIFRLFLVIPGHILRRLPIGNVGTTRVSAFRKMEIPTDLQDLLR